MRSVAIIIRNRKEWKEVVPYIAKHDDWWTCREYTKPVVMYWHESIFDCVNISGGIKKFSKDRYRMMCINEWKNVGYKKEVV